MYSKQNVKVNAACENCLVQTAELIEKQRKESDFLIVSSKTIVFLMARKVVVKKKLAERTKIFLITCGFFKTILSFNFYFLIKGFSHKYPV